MGVEDLVFHVTTTGDEVFEPERILPDTLKELSLLNLGEDTLEGLGIYIIPASNLGSVDYPADFPPDTDYQDLMTWGTNTVLGIELSGGLRITIPQDSGTTTTYITRTTGSLFENKLSIKSLAPNEEVVLGFNLETPPSVSARRVYIGLAVDQD